jgi:hypothetical protein
VGQNSLSAVWRKVDLDWSYEHRTIEVPEGSAYIPSPDSEELDGPVAIHPVETAVAQSATVQWSMPPPVMPDGANWLVDPRLEG